MENPPSRRSIFRHVLVALTWAGIGAGVALLNPPLMIFVISGGVVWVLLGLYFRSHFASLCTILYLLAYGLVVTSAPIPLWY